MKRITTVLFLFLNLNSFADGCSGDATFIATYDPLDCCWSFVNTTTNDCMEWNCTWDFGDGSPPVTTAQGVGTACHPYMYSGTYTVTLIFDSSPCHGGSGGICIGTQEVTIPPLSVTSTVSNHNGYNVSCEGASDGWITLNSAVGYTYEWQTIPIQYGNSISNLTAGTYFCNVGHNGCVDVFTVTLTEPLMQTNEVIQHLLCSDDANGSIDLTITGGCTPFSYLWSHGPTIEDVNNLTAGLYSVDITDVNGIIKTFQFQLTEPPLLILTSNFAHDSCDRQIGMAEVIVSGGVFPYNYLWSNNQITPVVNNLYGGNYSVVITDANNCIISEQFDIVVVHDPVAEFNIAPYLNMHHLYWQMDNPIFFIDKSIDDFTVIAKWFWEFEDGFTSNNQDTKHSFAEIGDFKVTLAIENLYGCVDTTTKRIIVEEFLLYIPNSFTPEYDGINDVFLPKGIGVAEYQLKIYNRWGEHFFTSDDLNIGWDGTTEREERIVQTGVYVYLINVIDIFGQKHTYNGQVTLIK